MASMNFDGFISALNALFNDANEPIYHYIRFLELTFREKTPPFINSAEYEKQLHAYLLEIIANKSECFRIINEILQHFQNSLQINSSLPTTNPFLLPPSPLLPQAQASNLPTPTSSSSSSSIIPTTFPQTPGTSVPIIKKVTSISSKPLPEKRRSDDFRVPAAPIQRNPASAVDQSPDRSVNARRNSSASGSGGLADNATCTPKAALSANKPPRTASDLEHLLQEEGVGETEEQEENTTGITLSSNDDADERTSPKATPKNSRFIDQLEVYLEELGDQIEKLETAELSLDELDREDSAYVEEGRLKERYMRNWKKLKEARGEPQLTGRPLETPFRFSRRSQTRWPVLNRRLEQRINRRVARAHSPAASARCPLHASAKSKTGASGAIRRSKSPGRRPKCCCRGANQLEEFGHIVDYEFPDFPDVLAIVKKLVAAGKLRLASGESERSVAEEAFALMGQAIQKWRRRDTAFTIATYMRAELPTAAADAADAAAAEPADADVASAAVLLDPAETDELLAKRLNDNDAEYKVKMDHILDDYVKREKCETSAGAPPEAAAAIGSTNSAPPESEVPATPTQPLTTARHEIEGDKAVAAAALTLSERDAATNSTPSALKPDLQMDVDEEAASASAKVAPTQKLPEDNALNASQTISFLLPTPPSIPLRATSVSPPVSPDGPASAGRSSYGHLPVLCPLDVSGPRNTRCLAPEVHVETAPPMAADADANRRAEGDRGASFGDAAGPVRESGAPSTIVVNENEASVAQSSARILRAPLPAAPLSDACAREPTAHLSGAGAGAEAQSDCIDIESSSETEDGETRSPPAAALCAAPLGDKASNGQAVIVLEDDEAHEQDSSDDDVQFVSEERPFTAGAPKLNCSTSLSPRISTCTIGTPLPQSPAHLLAAGVDGDGRLNLSAASCSTGAKHAADVRELNAREWSHDSASSAVAHESNDWDEHLSVEACGSDECALDSSSPSKWQAGGKCGSSPSGKSYLALAANPFAYNVQKISEKHPHLPAHQAASIHRWLADMPSGAEPPPDASISASAAAATNASSESVSVSAVTAASSAAPAAVSAGTGVAKVSLSESATATPPESTPLLPTARKVLCTAAGEAQPSPQLPRASAERQSVSVSVSKEETFYSPAAGNRTLQQSYAERSTDAPRLSTSVFMTPKCNTTQVQCTSTPVAVEAGARRSHVQNAASRSSGDTRSPDRSASRTPTAAKHQADSQPELAATPEKRARSASDRISSSQKQSPAAEGNWQQMLSIRTAREQREEHSQFETRNSRGFAPSQQRVADEQFDKYAQADRERGSPGAEGYGADFIPLATGFAPPRGDQLSRNMYAQSLLPVGYGVPLAFGDFRRSQDSAASLGMGPPPMPDALRMLRETPPPPSYQPVPPPLQPMVAPQPFAAPPPSPQAHSYAYSGYVTGFSTPLQWGNEDRFSRFFRPPGWLPSEWSDERRPERRRTPPPSWHYPNSNYSRGRGGGASGRHAQHRSGRGGNDQQRHNRGPSNKSPRGSSWLPRK